MRRTPDSEVQRARQRVLNELRPSATQAVTQARELPKIRRCQVQDKFHGRTVIVLEGYVIDVGGFAREHPGGEGLLRAGYGGRDLSEAFYKLNHHSRHAKGLVEDMRIAQVIND